MVASLCRRVAGHGLPKVVIADIIDIIDRGCAGAVWTEWSTTFSHGVTWNQTKHLRRRGKFPRTVLADPVKRARREMLHGAVRC